MVTEEQSMKKKEKNQRSRYSCHYKLTVKTKLVLQSSGQINSNSFLINMIQANRKQKTKTENERTLAFVFTSLILYHLAKS